MQLGFRVMNTLHDLKRFSVFAVACSLLLTVSPSPVRAGCGCLKPPPPPPLEPLAAPLALASPPLPAPQVSVLPHMAFPGMTVSIFSHEFEADQTWQVTFQNGERQVTQTNVPVSLQWDLWDINADGTRKTKTPRLVVTLPARLPPGPTSITISGSSRSVPLSIPASEFAVIGKPIMVAEQTAKIRAKNYAAAVGTIAVDKYIQDGQERTSLSVAPEGRLYIALGGLDKVCKPMNFKALIKDNPLRFSYGDVSIINTQGFLIEDLGPETSDHFTPRSNAGYPNKSDRFDYWRHSFVDYCAEHQVHGLKEIDPADPYWHLDGTPHVDYATLIFVIAAHKDDSSTPPVGPTILNLKVETEVDGEHGDWEDADFTYP